MSESRQFIITVRFSPWVYDNDNTEYPASGVRYLIEVPDMEEDILAYFLQVWREKVGGQEAFAGEILFVEPSWFVVL